VTVDPILLGLDRQIQAESARQPWRRASRVARNPLHVCLNTFGLHEIVSLAPSTGITFL
jgi:hypothetical protein